MNDQLILENMKYVRYIARQYANAKVHYEDLVQEGVVGLLIARKNFNPSFNVKFITYAIYYIKEHIHAYAMKFNTPFVIIDVENIPNEDKPIELVVNKIQLIEKVNTILNNPDSRNIEIIRDRLNGKSLPELSKQYGISFQRVAQLEADGLKIIRNQLLKREK